MTLLRRPSLPVPTQTRSPSSWATVIAPIEGVVKKPSDTLRQLLPKSVVFQTPPPVAPM